jgi:hypothetical protein
MVIVKDKSYLVTTRIELGQFFGRAPEEAPLTLKETNVKQTMRIRAAAQKGDDEAFIVFSEIFPEVITDHAFYKSETERMTNAEVVELIMERPEMYAEVVRRFIKDTVFTLGSKSGEKSETSPEESSTEK